MRIILKKRELAKLEEVRLNTTMVRNIMKKILNASDQSETDKITGEEYFIIKNALMWAIDTSQKRR
jgi:hypothetical protein